MNTQFLAEMFSAHIGIDLGTANCLVYVRDHGVVLNEPSVVAIKVNTKEVLAVGTEAKDMLGKTPGNIQAIRPMREGVIANYEVTEEMLRYFIQRAIRTVPWYKRLLRPRVLIAVPSGITEVEHRAVTDSAKHAGAGTLVPITGFANAIAAPAVEFKTEGFVLGVGAKMFTIAGPVIVYGVSASVFYGIIYWIYTMFTGGS